MMEKMRKLMRRRNKESGSADIIVTLFTIPFAIALILALIDISMYMNTRSHVESAVRDGVRNAAMWGGAGSPKQVRLNSSGQSVAQNISTRLWNGKTCNHSHCAKAPAVSCTPAVAATAGTTIRCTVKYFPKSSVSGGLSLLGFGAITNGAYTVTESAISETGYSR